MGSDSGSSTSVKGAMKDAKNSFNRVLESPQNGVGVLRKTLKSAMKSAVDSTNKTLASIDESTETIRKPIVESANKGKKLVHQASNMYAVRQQYGLENITGAAFLGALVGLRRGRIPAVTIGSISGFLAYVFVYQVDARHLPSKILGRQ